MTTALDSTRARGVAVAPTTWRARTALGSLALVGLVATSILITLAATSRTSILSPTSRFEFPGWMSGPLGGLFTGVTHDQHTLKIEFTIVVAAMYVLYLIALACVRAVPAWAVLGAIVAVHVAFFLSPPLVLTDIFNYINYARMGVVHGLNPYVHVPAAVSTDRIFRLTTWHHLRSPYGPLFTLGTYPLGPLPLAAGYWIFKAAVMAASLGCLALLWKCAEAVGRPARAAVAFVGLNPLFTVYGLGGEHNDVFMMLLVLTGVFMMLRSREEWGGAALAGAVAVKASAGVLLPVVLLGARRRGRAFAGAAACAVVIGLTTLVVFGPHLPNDSSQSRLVVPFGLANVLGLALGLGGVTTGLRHVLELTLAGGVVAACVVALRGRWLVPAAAVSLLAILTLTWVMPWYIFWVLPLAALVPGRTLRIATLVAGVSLLLTWLPLGQEFAHENLHLFPTRTAVGKQNSAYLHRLLR
jgi:hypothetical protein